MHHVTDIEPIPHVDDRGRDIDKEIETVLREIDANFAPSRWTRFIDWLMGLIRL